MGQKPEHHPDCDGKCPSISLRVSISGNYAHDANAYGCLPDWMIERWTKTTARLHVQHRCWLMELLSRSDFEADPMGRDSDPDTRAACRAAARAFTALQKAANAAGLDIGRWAHGGPGRPPMPVLTSQ